jgi:hypothetical protein
VDIAGGGSVHGVAFQSLRIKAIRTTPRVMADRKVMRASI